jgi:hypothetical protein
MKKIFTTSNSCFQSKAATTLFLFLCLYSVSALAQPLPPSFATLALNMKSSAIGTTTSLVTVRSVQSEIYQDGSEDQHGDDNHLPVRLENFNGIYANGFTKLGWNTLMEYNLGDFIVERSRNGSDYAAIGKVAAFGNTNNFSSYYTYLDISCERGTNFYRLKMIDKDSAFSYSKVIVINTEAREISLLLVYPNPFGKKVQAKIECEKAEKLTVRVISSNGQVVRTQYNNLQPGENVVTVNNVADLPNGTYILEMVAASRTMRTQIVKQE